MAVSASPFVQFLAEKPLVLLTGPLGTELQRRGYQTSLPLWSAQANLEAADLVTQIHEDYFRAGADIAITNTFRTTPRTYRKVGREDDARPAMLAAIAAARRAQAVAPDRPTFVGGSFAPLEDCYEPDLVPDNETLAREHTQLAGWLAAGGVDFLFPETINSLREAKAMASAASATGLPFIISFVTDDRACLLDGTPMDVVLAATDLPGRVGIGLNCRPVDVIDGAFAALPACDGATCLYANGFGHADDDLGWVFEENDDTLQKYTDAARGWKNAGAKIIGGCCGTSPAYIRALADALA